MENITKELEEKIIALIKQNKIVEAVAMVQKDWRKISNNTMIYCRMFRMLLKITQ